MENKASSVGYSWTMCSPSSAKEAPTSACHAKHQLMPPSTMHAGMGVPQIRPQHIREHQRPRPCSLKWHNVSTGLKGCEISQALTCRWLTVTLEALAVQVARAAATMLSSLSTACWGSCSFSSRHACVHTPTSQDHRCTHSLACLGFPTSDSSQQGLLRVL